ncbi:hypothetical protein [Brevundimonas sp.]|uniref:hypothetical protein n=1 Tax=Brevundimonas sp. TaxID=1871086 RepID=UPI002D3987F4|nr:hypothetical protein [Brevundimonas sp.]HYC67842.1 hypothetical protein [Brevundimonas sp.]
MIVGGLLALALSAQQVPPAPPAPVEEPIRLEDVVVDARRLESAAEEYVDLIAAPAGRRGLARWHDGVCVGVANLENALSQQLADQVSDVVRSLGLRAHEPPCHPSVLIIATTDAARFAEEFVAMRPVLFRVGSPGMDRGKSALRAFMTEDRPVRWWHVSLPIDSQTGMPVIRMPGEVNGAGVGAGSVMDYAPITNVNSPSRLSSQYVDVLKRVFIIVDVDRLNNATAQQLGAYLAMVALAQINPEADTRQFDTILNLFDDPAAAPPGLSGWDQAYLEGLYGSGSESHRINQRSQVQAVAAAIADAYRDLPDETEPAPVP